MSNNLTYTENRAIQYKSTLNKCLDFFSSVGGMRFAERDKIKHKFLEAFYENPKLAMQILFWSRAARLGAGERASFHLLFEEIAKEAPLFLEDNAEILAELGYWKDLLPYFYNKKIVEVFANAIANKDRLACKWAPRKGESAILLRDALKFSNKQYRKWLKEYSESVEQKMADSDWHRIEYSSVPGQAMRKYRKAFDSHDKDGFDLWKNDKKSKASVSASYPHDIVKLLFYDEFLKNLNESADFDLAEKQWSNLPDYIKPGENILPLIDVSGSMIGLPMLISVSLGLYLSERNKESFKNTFITFSKTPELIRVPKDANLKQRLLRVSNANWGMNTNIEKVYKLILDTARSFSVSQKAMPTMLLILSDMQFDQSAEERNRPHFDLIKEKYRKAGYEMPKLVFWNLRDSICDGSPAKADGDDEVALVSGFNPVIMKAVLNVSNFTPIDIMNEVLESTKEKINYENLPTHLTFMIKEGTETLQHKTLL